MAKYKLFDGTQTVTIIKHKRRKEITEAQDNVTGNIEKLETLNMQLQKSTKIGNWILWIIAGTAFIIVLTIGFITLRILRVLS